MTRRLAAPNSRTLQRLILVQCGEDAKNNGGAGVHLETHECVRDGIADVLEVHGGTLDEDSDGDDGVERLAGGGCRGGCGGRCSRAGFHCGRKDEATEKVCCSRTSLDMRCTDHPANTDNMCLNNINISETMIKHVLCTGKGKLKASWYGLHNDVGRLYATLSELLDSTVNERVNDRFVPSRVHDGYAQLRAVVGLLSLLDIQFYLPIRFSLTSAAGASPEVGDIEET